MEKELKRLIRILKAEYALMWVLTVLLAALYECDILPQGLLQAMPKWNTSCR